MCGTGAIVADEFTAIELGIGDGNSGETGDRIEDGDVALALVETKEESPFKLDVSVVVFFISIGAGDATCILFTGLPITGFGTAF